MEKAHLARQRTIRSPRRLGDLLLGVLVTATAALLAGACSTDPGGTEGTNAEEGALQPLDLTSSAFGENERIPVRFTCEGENVSPPLSWSGVPEGTEALVLSMEDPDAPSGTFHHWSVANLDPGDSSFDAAMTAPDAVVGMNDFGEAAYGGPCPPEGDEPHRYVFTLHAVDRQMPLESGFTPEEMRRALEGAEIGRGELIGLFSR